MNELIFLVETAPDGGYTARALGCSIFTQGETVEELKTAITDAVRCHFEEKEMPHIIRLHMVHDEVMAL